MPVIAFAFVAGVLTILAPCTLPIVPLVLGSASAGGRARAFAVLLGFGAAFVAVTEIFAETAARMGVSSAGLRLIGAGGLAAFGACLVVPRTRDFAERALAPLARVGARIPYQRSGVPGGLVLGVSIGLLWAPCVGPLMAGVIALAVARGPSPEGLAVSVAYVAGAGLPLGTVAAFGRRAVARAGSAARRARVLQAFGALMLAAALVVLAGADLPLESIVSNMQPGALGDAAVQVEALAASGSGPGSAGSQPAEVMPSPSRPGSTPIPLPDLGPAPALTGITAWINSPPLTLAALRGRVVLVHFWTFDCINCIHVQPYVKAWYARYRAMGFVVIGVHTPELSFERDLANVRAAVSQDGVLFPVAFDPSYATWNAFHNRYWPAFYFIDKKGHIRHTWSGEGGYATSEAVIRELLAQPG